MAAFDRLPQAARRAVANAAFDWATQPFLTEWNKGRITPPALAQWVQRIDAEAVGADARRTYGKEHPQARVRIRATRQKGKS